MTTFAEQEQTISHVLPINASYRKAIVFESSALFVPYLDVVMMSLLQFANDKDTYDIIVLSKEIDNYNQAAIKSHAKGRENISIRFFDPTEIVKKYVENSRYSYLEINYYRMALPWILSDYDFALNLGADIVINRDVCQLLNTDIKDTCYLAGVVDLGYLGRLDFDIPKEELGMKNPYSYVNADVLIYDLKKIRRDYSIDDVMDIWQKYYFRCSEQDALNLFFDGHIQHVQPNWNVFPHRMTSTEDIMRTTPEHIQEWKNCLNDPYIIHFAAVPKPWDYPMVGFGDLWWQLARKSVYYEEIIRRMCIMATVHHGTANRSKWRIIADIILPVGSKGRELLKKMFPRNSRRRRILKRILLGKGKVPVVNYGKSNQ